MFLLPSIIDHMVSSKLFLLFRLWFGSESTNYKICGKNFIMSLVDYIKQKRKIRKILIAGTGAVGKTSLLKVLKNKKYLKELNSNDLKYNRTLFMEFEKIQSSKKSGIFQLYDVAGQLDLPFHAFRDTARLTFGNVDLILILFSNNNVQSLLDVENWLDKIKEYYLSENNNNGIPKCLLINNKADLESTIDTFLIKAVTNQSEIIKFFEISCLNGKGIEELGNWLDNYFFGGENYNA